MTDPTTKAEPITFEKTLPDYIDGRSYVFSAHLRWSDWDRVDGVATPVDLRAAGWVPASELAELRAKLGLVRDQRDTETSTKNARIESLDRERRDLGDKAIRLEVQLAELRVENERLKAERPHLLEAAELLRLGVTARSDDDALRLRAWRRADSDQAKAAEPEATVVAEPEYTRKPVGRNSWTLGTCKGCGGTNAALFDGPYCCKPCRLKAEGRDADRAGLSPDVARAAEAVEAQDPMLRPVTFGELVDVIREVRTGFGGTAGELASELAKHLEHRATGGAP